MLKTFSIDNKFVKNFFSLSVLQIMNYIFPLITVPYLVKVLGMDKFGEIQFAIVLISFMVIINDFGNSLTGVRKVAINRNSTIKLQNELSNILLTQCLITIIISIIFWLLVILFGSIFNDVLLYVISYFFFIANVYTPIWIFRGLEKLVLFSIVTLISKALMVLLIFILVSSLNEYIIYPLLLLISQALIMVFTWLILIRQNIYPNIKSIDLSKLLVDFKESWYVFSATILAAPYTTLTPIFVGLYLDKSATGVYVIAEKVYKGIFSFLQVAQQVLFPHNSRIFNEEKTIKRKYLIQMLILLSSPTMILIILSILFSNEIFKIIIPNYYSVTSNIYLILSSLFLVKTIAHVYLLQILVNFNFNKEVLTIVLVGLLFYLISFPFLIIGYSVNGAAMAAVLPEVVVLIISIYKVNKHDIITV